LFGVFGEHGEHSPLGLFAVFATRARGGAGLLARFKASCLARVSPVLTPRR